MLGFYFKTMEKEFVPYQEALELKELGFDEPCFVVWPGIEDQKLGYDGRYFSLTKGYKNSKLLKEVKRYAPGIIDIAAPTFSQVFRWFREKYDLFSSCDISNFADKTYGYVITSSIPPHYLHDMHNLKSMEEAELECLKKLIEIVKQK